MLRVGPCCFSSGLVAVLMLMQRLRLHDEYYILHYISCICYQGWAQECHDPNNGPIPVTLCLVLMAMYICGGAMVFAHVHSWSYLHALYFCFSALTTIGFGDLNPTSYPQDTANAQLQLLGVSLYLLIGMALIATCFNLMQEQVTSRGGGSTVLTRKLGGLVTTPTAHHRFHLDDT